MKRRHFIQAGLAFGGAAILSEQVAQSAENKSKKIPIDQNEVPKPSFKKKIRIAQIGVRHEHATGKMDAMVRLPDYYEILGIAAESPEWEKRHRNNASYKGLKWMSQDELLALPGLEAVAVETEMTELLPTAIRCAERGLHMHVDKPLGEELEECRKMLDACRKNNVIMQPGYMFRGNPAIQLAIKLVREGALGEIYDIYASMNRYDVSPGFRKWLATYRGGGMYDFGSHLVDIVVSMLGMPKDIKVIERPVGGEGLSDNTLSVLIYEKAIAQLRVSELDGLRARRLIVSGTNGTFELIPIEGSYTNYPTFKNEPLVVQLNLRKAAGGYKAGKQELRIPAPQGRYSEQMIDFANYIRGVKKNPYSLDYELQVQKVILAASGYTEWKPEK